MNMLTTICANANALMERHFGLQDVEYADDTNLIHTHLTSLRVLAKCSPREAAYYVVKVKNAQEGGKCYLLKFHPDIPNVVIKDLQGFSRRA